MEKIIVIDKPKGLTSNAMVQLYKKRLKIKKIGHAGTLDPFATGVLILLIDQATKKFSSFLKLEKEYQMTIKFGMQTDTDDPEGKTIKKLALTDQRLKITKAKLSKVLASFTGEYLQQVPKYSAVKFKGKPLYQYARQGIKVKLPVKKVKIKEIKLLSFKPLNQDKKNYPQVKIKVICSSGTYMRSLAKDLGKKLNLPGMATALRRTRIGNYQL